MPLADIEAELTRVCERIQLSRISNQPHPLNSAELQQLRNISRLASVAAGSGSPGHLSEAALRHIQNYSGVNNDLC